jgi:hypothetical protein
MWRTAVVAAGGDPGKDDRAPEDRTVLTSELACAVLALLVVGSHYKGNRYPTEINFISSILDILYV